MEEQRRPYVLAVSGHQRRWQRGRQERIARLVADLPTAAGVTLSAGEGRQGPRRYDGAWVLGRRSLSDPTELAYYRVYGPEDTPLEELVRVAGTRGSSEESFERAKGTVGLDEYEVRRWEAWYRHITLAVLAHASLDVTRLHATRDEEAPKGSLANTDELIPLTVPEVRRLLVALSEPEERFNFRLTWSRWRRRHQAGAQRCPRARRARPSALLCHGADTAA